jgi:hypothetical protein
MRSRHSSATELSRVAGLQFDALVAATRSGLAGTTLFRDPPLIQ